MKDLVLGVIILAILICVSLSFDADPSTEALEKNNTVLAQSCVEEHSEQKSTCH